MKKSFLIQRIISILFLILLFTWYFFYSQKKITKLQNIAKKRKMEIFIRKKQVVCVKIDYKRLYKKIRKTSNSLSDKKLFQAK